MFIGKYNKSVIVTYIGIISAILGMFLSIEGNMSYAMICLIISGICDLFDGKIARMCKRDEEEKEFGKQLDSLADVFLFLGLPCVIGMKLFTEIPSYLSIIVLILYVLAGVIRLAWFNIIADKDGPVKYFVGMPVAYIALLTPIIYALNLVVKFTYINYVYLIIYAAFAFLFILNVKIPKPKGIWYGIFSLLAIVVVTMILIMG